MKAKLVRESLIERTLSNKIYTSTQEMEPFLIYHTGYTLNPNELRVYTRNKLKSLGIEAM